MPDEARDGRNVALKWQLEVKSHLLACLIVQNNHPTINSSMPNNFHASNASSLECSLTAQDQLVACTVNMPRGQILERIKHVVYCSKLTRRFGPNWALLSCTKPNVFSFVQLNYYHYYYCSFLTSPPVTNCRFCNIIFSHWWGPRIGSKHLYQVTLTSSCDFWLVEFPIIITDCMTCITGLWHPQFPHFLQTELHNYKCFRMWSTAMYVHTYHANHMTPA